jgi:hypothetical protein
VSSEGRTRASRRVHKNHRKTFSLIVMDVSLNMVAQAARLDNGWKYFSSSNDKNMPPVVSSREGYICDVLIIEMTHMLDGMGSCNVPGLEILATGYSDAGNPAWTGEMP